MDRQAHWDRVYSTRSAEELSWFQRHPALSIELIQRTGAGPAAAVVDIGGGDSLLVDSLLDLEYRDLTVLDVSPAALDRARRRLGARGEAVHWIACDVTHYAAERGCDVWHDRAVFHFLTDPADRVGYLEAMEQALCAGGSAVLATFSLEGPLKCSGLDVRPYSAETLAQELGRSFRLMEHREKVHQTPEGKMQSFIYARFLKTV